MASPDSPYRWLPATEEDGDGDDLSVTELNLFPRGIMHPNTVCSANCASTCGTELE